MRFFRKEDEFPDEPIVKKRRAIFFSSVIVAVIFTVLIYNAVSSDLKSNKHNNHNKDSNNTNNSINSTSDKSNINNDRPAGCQTDDSDQSIPNAPPKDLEWKNIRTMVLPTSKSSGPTMMDGYIWHCYAHTPMGAVEAANVILINIYESARNHDDYINTINKLTVKDDNQTKLINAWDSSFKDDNLDIYGFKVFSYTKDNANIQIIMKVDNDMYGSTDVNVRWDNGDWKILVYSDGSTFNQNIVTVNDTKGFNLWRSN